MTETAEKYSDIAARRVRELREERGWSAARLAERCAELGAPQITASVIANIETGRRDSQGRRRRRMTVDEAVFFCSALETKFESLTNPDSRSMSIQEVGDFLAGPFVIEQLPDGRFFFRKSPSGKGYRYVQRSDEGDDG